MTTTVINQNSALVSIPEDLQCTIVAATGSSAIVQRIHEEVILETVTIAAGETVVFGEYLVDVVLRVTCLTGSVTYNVAQRTTQSSVPADGGSVAGAVGNLTTITAGQHMHLPANAQSLVFGSLTVNGTYQVDGELRVQSWPA